jgi:large subunit ribosomal protein L4e
MTNSDLGRLLRADEVQRALKEKSRERRRTLIKRNPLKNTRALARLNPFAIVQKRIALRKHKQV